MPKPCVPSIRAFGPISQRFVLLLAFLAYLAAPAVAQSPHTASMIIVTVDQTGGVVKDAKVAVKNSATGDIREAVSGSDGSVTIPGLPLTGTYTVSVSKAGF